MRRSEIEKYRTLYAGDLDAELDLQVYDAHALPKAVHAGREQRREKHPRASAGDAPLPKCSGLQLAPEQGDESEQQVAHAGLHLYTRLALEKSLELPLGLM